MMGEKQSIEEDFRRRDGDLTARRIEDEGAVRVNCGEPALAGCRAGAGRDRLAQTCGMGQPSAAEINDSLIDVQYADKIDGVFRSAMFCSVNPPAGV